MKKYLLICALFVMGCSSNNDNEDNTVNEDVVKEVPKDGSIETVITTTHDSVGGVDLLNITNKVWVKGQLDKVITRVDTLPSLGDTTMEVTSGDSSKTVQNKKDYKFFITVK